MIWECACHCGWKWDRNRKKTQITRERKMDRLRKESEREAVSFFFPVTKRILLSTTTDTIHILRDYKTLKYNPLDTKKNTNIQTCARSSKLRSLKVTLSSDMFTFTFWILLVYSFFQWSHSLLPRGNGMKTETEGQCWGHWLLSPQRTRFNVVWKAVSQPVGQYVLFIIYFLFYYYKKERTEN